MEAVNTALEIYLVSPISINPVPAGEYVILCQDGYTYTVAPYTDGCVDTDANNLHVIYPEQMGERVGVLDPAEADRTRKALSTLFKDL